MLPFQPGMTDSVFLYILSPPAYLQACRAFMILSLLVGLAAIIISVLGLKCTKIGQTSEHTKDQIALSGGIMFILSGMRLQEYIKKRVIIETYSSLDLCVLVISSCLREEDCETQSNWQLVIECHLWNRTQSIYCKLGLKCDQLITFELHTHPDYSYPMVTSVRPPLC